MIVFIVVFMGSKVFPFREGSMRFETPPERRRKRATPATRRTVPEGYSIQDYVTVTPRGEIGDVSPEMEQFGRHLMAEIEERTNSSVRYMSLFLGW